MVGPSASLIPSGFGDLLPSPSGGQFVQLTASNDPGVTTFLGSLSSGDLLLEAGTTYQLTFDYNSNLFQNNEPFKAGFGTDLTSFDISGMNAYIPFGTTTPWRNGVVDFTATTTGNQKIVFETFARVGPGLSNAVVHLDNIKVSAVPEPSQAMLLGLGLLGFILQRKQKGSVSASPSQQQAQD